MKKITELVKLTSKEENELNKDDDNNSSNNTNSERDNTIKEPKDDSTKDGGDK